MDEDCKTNSHEPNLRELAAEIRGFMRLMNERDKRYCERYDAQEKAIGKAEMAQNAYNVVHNDLSRKMDAQYKEMLPRSEADSRFDSVNEKIAELRESRSEGGGRGAQATESRDQMRWALGFAMSVIGMVVGVATTALFFLSRK